MSSITRNSRSSAEPVRDLSPRSRSPVFARNAVATSQPLATQAGISALQRGGNAVDAALSAAITLTVVEPCSNGLGSDAFAMVWDGETLSGLNASGRSPSAWSLDRFSGRTDMPTRGWESVTVPGAVSGWVALSERFGRLPFPALFEPAIHYAETGFPVGPRTAAAWARAAQVLRKERTFAQHFLPDGDAPRAGDVFASPDLARSLKLIADSSGKAFYQGLLAQTLVSQSEREGGAMTLQDLEDHQPEWVQPLTQEFGGGSLHEIPPNGQGLAALIALALLDRLDVNSREPNSSEWLHLQIEAMKIAIRTAFDQIADPAHMRMSPEELLEPSAIRRAAARITSQASPDAVAPLPSSKDTVCLATGDDSGMMVSFIQSNYIGFGSGVVVEGTGIALQNRGAGFVTELAHPNQVDGGKRPFHTIIPAFVTRAGEPALAFGLMGGHMQHQGHIQMVTRIFGHGQDPQSASDEPRWHVSPDHTIYLERGYDFAILDDLASRGHRVHIGNDPGLFGGAQLVLRCQNGYCAGSDHRKEGNAAGF